ncbi:MAG: nodulation protein NfeD [Spirochaetia bacterium]|nr:nodulation protein NfeD [Spirochaetia bacterium]
MKKKISLKSTLLLSLILYTFIFISYIYSNSENSFKKVYHILPHALEEMEDARYASFLEKTFNKAYEDNPVLVIVEIDTPGGELISTLKIKNLIQQYGRNTLCFINKNAISAGSLIALSCDKLVMAQGAVIGGATPVLPDAKEGMKKAPEKVVSVARAAWRSTAESRGKNAEIAEAFVDENLILTKSKHGIDKPKGTLLTLSTKEAVSLRIADYEANSINEILEKENLTDSKVVVFKPDFIDKLLGFFLHPAVSGILIGLGFLGLLYEIKVPGWGIPGTLGILFLSIYFISRIMVGVSGWEAPALFALGILLLLLEVFVIPGFGIAGLTGAICILGSILWSYGIDNFEEGLWVTAFALTGTIALTALLAKYLPAIAKKNTSFFLNETLNKDPEEMGERKLKKLLNKEGVSETVLRPSGIIKVEGKKIDAVSAGDFIEQGQRVKIITVEGHRVVVEKIS